MNDAEEACFYILDVRSVVGNCAVWWCPNAQGYTCDIDKAGLYTAKQAHGMRGTDIPVHRDVVNQLITRHVRLDHVRQAGVLDAYDKAKAEELKAEKDEKAKARRRGRRA